MKVRAGIAGVVAVLAVTTTAGALSVSPPPIYDAEPGSVHLLTSEANPPGDVGKECGATITTSNNESVRQGSDLIVKSATELVVPNVEATTGSTTVKGTIILGPTLTVSVRIGPGRQYSGGITTVDVVCPQVGPPISSPPPPAPPVVAPPKFTG